MGCLPTNLKFCNAFVLAGRTAIGAMTIVEFAYN